MHTLPQEIEVWYIIPAIRRELAKCLIKEYGLTYEKVGGILGISKAAISQYLKNKRAAKIKLHEKALHEVCNSCSKITKGKSNAVDEITRVLKLIREKQWAVEICDKKLENVFENCKEIKVA